MALALHHTVPDFVPRIDPVLAAAYCHTRPASVAFLDGRQRMGVFRFARTGSGYSALGSLVPLSVLEFFPHHSYRCCFARVSSFRHFLRYHLVDTAPVAAVPTAAAYPYTLSFSPTHHIPLAPAPERARNLSRTSHLT